MATAGAKVASVLQPSLGQTEPGGEVAVTWIYGRLGSEAFVCPSDFDCPERSDPGSGRSDDGIDRTWDELLTGL